MRCRPLPVLTVALMAALAPAYAQTSPERTRLEGLTLDHWRNGGGAAMLRPTLRRTTYVGRGPGLDLSLVIFPDGISIAPPIVITGLQLGAAQPIPVGPATLLLKGGAAGIASAGLAMEHFHLIPGIHFGAGFLIPLDSRSWIRLDLTRHVYRTGGFESRIWSLGAGITGVRRRR